MFGSESNKSTFDQTGNQDKIEFGQCLLLIIQKVPISLLLSKNIKFKIYKIIIFL
jgi:hypothetical protein